MDWLTSLLQGQPGVSGGLPGQPVDPNNPFEPTVNPLNNAPPAGPPGVAPPATRTPTQDDKLITALRGVSAPPRPDVVKPSTPSLPHPLAIKAGALFDLLNQVSNPRAAAPRLNTLGGALGTGRY
jgi:hypothetical protein